MNKDDAVATIEDILERIVVEMRRQAPPNVLIGDIPTDLFAEALVSYGVMPGYARKCAACLLPIPGAEFAARDGDRLFHLSCMNRRLMASLDAHHIILEAQGTGETNTRQLAELIAAYIRKEGYLDLSMEDIYGDVMEGGIARFAKWLSQQGVTP